jgi:hypothetical protein
MKVRHGVSAWVVVGAALAWPYADWMARGEGRDEYSHSIRFQLLSFALLWAVLGLVALFAWGARRWWRRRKA